MKNGTIKIGGKEYPYVMNMRARRLFMKQFGLVSFQDYVEKIGVLESTDKGFTLDHLDVIGYLVISAIESATREDSELDPDDVWDHFESTPGALDEFMSGFVDAQEQPEKPKKTNPRSSGGKSKKGK